MSAITLTGLTTEKVLFLNFSDTRPSLALLALKIYIVLNCVQVKDIDVSLCTHINNTFATLDESTFTMNTFDSWLDIDLKNYEKFVGSVPSIQLRSF